MLSLCTVELSFGFVHRAPSFFFFFFNDTATTEIYTLSLHDALPISLRLGKPPRDREPEAGASGVRRRGRAAEKRREDALAVFGRDAGAPIPHGKQERPALARDPQLHGSTRRRIAQRVLDQVAQDAECLHEIEPPHQGRLGHVDRRRDRAAAEHRLQLACDRADDVFGGGWLERDPGEPAPPAGQVEEFTAATA